MIKLILLLFALTGVVRSGGGSSHRPFAYLAEVEPVLERLRSPEAAVVPPADAAALWTKAGEAYEAARNVSAASAAREAAEAAAAVAAAEAPGDAGAARALLLARVALADALRAAGDFERARDVLARARAWVSGRSSGAAAADAVLAALWRAESKVELCAPGRHREAVAAWDLGAPDGAGAAWPVRALASPTDVALALDLMKLLNAADEDSGDGACWCAFMYRGLARTFKGVSLRSARILTFHTAPLISPRHLRYARFAQTDAINFLAPPPIRSLRPNGCH
jgi:hypothetical protein